MEKIIQLCLGKFTYSTKDAVTYLLCFDVVCLSYCVLIHILNIKGEKERKGEHIHIYYTMIVKSIYKRLLPFYQGIIILLTPKTTCKTMSIFLSDDTSQHCHQTEKKKTSKQPNMLSFLLFFYLLFSLMQFFLIISIVFIFAIESCTFIKTIQVIFMNDFPPLI